MNRRRSSRRRPQIQPSEVAAGVACRRSLRLHPQIHVSEEGAGSSGRRRRPGRGTSPAALASPLEDDDLLREILLRLPPQPSSLPRASVVCKRWRGLVTDPKFHQQVYAHHRKPPFLGVFLCTIEEIVFTPVLDPPNRIPPVRFSIGPGSSLKGCRLLDCHHGLVLLRDFVSGAVVVCDPITGGQRRVTEPPEFKRSYTSGAVLCAAGKQGHVHGDCHSGPFKVVLMSMYLDLTRPIVCVYSSETGKWCNLISTEATYQLGGDASIPATLVGNALYWFSMRGLIVEFDLDGQSINVITGPPVTDDMLCQNHRIFPAEDGALGFAELSFPHLQMWRRNVNGHGTATWVRWKSIEMDTIIGLPSQTEALWEWLMGYDEDNEVAFLLMDESVYMVQFKSMQSRKLYASDIPRCYPFMSFYTPGTAINGGSNGAQMLRVT